jgi:hypothetical protein
MNKFKHILAIALTVVLFSSVHIVAFRSSGLHNPPQVALTPLAVSNYLEDFTNDSLRDPVITTAPGWGMGVVTNQRQLSLTQLDFYSTPNKIVDVAVQGRKVYATANNQTDFVNTLYCLNITDPSDIEYMSHRDSQRGFLTGDVQGDMYYNGGSHNGGWIGIYNVSNPYDFGGSGVFLTSYIIEGPVTDVEARGNILYGTVYNSTISRGLVMFDVEDPYNTVRIPNTIIFDETLGLDVVGQLAYLADGTFGLYIVNVSQPYVVSPSIGSVNTPGNATDVLIDGTLAYLADGPAGIQIIDVQDPTNPTILGSFDTNGNARRMALQGSTLFVADGTGGVVVIDVTLPTHPQLVAEIATPFAWDVDLYGGILVIGTDDGVYTLRTGMGLTGLPVVSTVTGGWDYWDVKVSGNIAYVAAGGTGLMIFNVKDPANPILLNHTSLPGSVWFRKLDIEGRYLYVCDFLNWVHTYDVSDPTYPVLVDSWGGSQATDIDVVGGVAYIAAGGFGFQIYNVSNPFSATWMGSFMAIGNATAVQAQGPHVYVADSTGGVGNAIYIFDIRNLVAPNPIGIGFTDQLFYDLYVDGDVLYTADFNWPIVWNVTNPFSPTFNFPGGWLYGNNTVTAWGFGPYMLSNNETDGLTLIDARNINGIQYMAVSPTVTDARQISVHGDYAYVATRDSFDIIHLFQSTASTYQTGTDIVRSLNIANTSDLIQNATLNFEAYVPMGTSITFALSADGGLHLESIIPGVLHTFTYPGYDLRWTANLTTTHVDASVHLYEITIGYEHAPLPPLILPDWLIYVLVAFIIIIVVVIIIILLLRRRKSK